MPELPIPGGLTNKEIIDHAYTGLGLSDSMFGRTAEEYATGLSFLRAMCGEWPFDQLGFDDAVAKVTEESGIERKWLNAVGYSLGEMLGAATGKQLMPQFKKVLTRSYSRLCSGVAVVPESDYAPATPQGSGHRIFYRGPFFPEVT